MAFKILVVDDVSIIRTSLKRELEEAGYEAAVAQDGQQALVMTQETAYDIVLLDLMMPGMDGVETCRRLHAAHPEIILILMTGNLESSVRKMEEEFLRSGGKIYYLYKPFHEGEVIDIVGKALKEAGRA